MKLSSLVEAGKILLASGFTVLAAAGLGRWFLRTTKAWKSLSRGERGVFAFGLGAAWLSNLVFLLCSAQLVYPSVLLVAGLAAIAAGLRGRAASQLSKTESRSAGLWLLAPVAVCYGYLYLMHSMAPEISADAASYHLGLVSRYLREHGFSRLTTNIYAMLSQGMEMLFLFAFAFGRHSAAKMVHFSFLVATIAAMISFGRRFGMRPAAATAAAFFAIAPVVGVDATSAYNDCALAFYIFATFYLLMIWDAERDAALLPAIGVAAGFCYAVKYTGFLAAPFALVFLARARRGWLPAAKRVALVAALFIAPWMLKNAIIIDNPVAPFFNRVFPNRYVHVSFERTYLFLMRHYGDLGKSDWRDYLHLPWELTVRGEKVQGVLGPLFLLAPLGLFSLRQKMGRRLWLAAAVFALPWLSNMGTRFLMPSLVFISLAMALALWQLPRAPAFAISALLVAGHAMACWPAVMGRWNSSWRLPAAPWRAALRIESETRYLERTFPDYQFARLIDRAVPAGARVLSCHGIAEAYTNRDIIANYQSALAEVLLDHLMAPALHNWSPAWSIRLKWRPQTLTALRLIQTGSPESEQPLDFEQWSIHELRLISAAGYVVPDRSWLLRARPNPWDAWMAMDGNPATRWRSWQPLSPGMRFEVDLPAPVELAGVDLECSPEQYHVALRAEGRDLSGRWTPLDAETERSERTTPPLGMKRGATHAIKARGVDYVLTEVEGSLDVIGINIERDPAAWGLRQVAEYGPFRIYRIEP